MRPGAFVGELRRAGAVFLRTGFLARASDLRRTGFRPRAAFFGLAGFFPRAGFFRRAATFFLRLLPTMRETLHPSPMGYSPCRAGKSEHERNRGEPLTSSAGETWPPLPLEPWQDTLATLHMWTQVVGKVCLALTPLTNHFWNIALQVTPRGLATPPLLSRGRVLTIAFDFVGQALVFRCSDGATETFPLEPRTVADFHRLVMDALRRLDVDVRIWTQPVEIPDPIRFEADTVHRSYDPAAANAFWRALLAMKPVFDRFRSGFIGKSSPVHFFWGSFDMAVTRFSGRRAPERPEADPITREAYSHEVISHGFWPGNPGGPVREAAFYAYAAPEPPGLKTAAVRPGAAAYHATLNEFVLPYEAVRTAPSPEKVLEAFLSSTYEAAADLAGWPRADLERRARKASP